MACWSGGRGQGAEGECPLRRVLEGRQYRFSYGMGTEGAVTNYTVDFAEIFLQSLYSVIF